MKMTLSVIVLGGILIFIPVTFIHICLPWMTISEQPSDIYRERSQLEAQGRLVYVNNGCGYCHTQFVRAFDWDVGVERVAHSGDYVGDAPHLVGTERTGPDLSQEGGEHPDDWHAAHFTNPRYVRPESIMPSWKFLGPENLRALVAYQQSLGFKMADSRVERQKHWKGPAVKAYESGPQANVEWLHANVPEPWRKLPDPYPTTQAGLQRGHRIYQGFCIGCHGPVGDGMGPAEPHLYPPPLNFTVLQNRGITGGILYYQIMNGITGTAMPYFKKELESDKIWSVGDYVAVTFIGESDAGAQPKGIGAAYEPSASELETLGPGKEW